MYFVLPALLIVCGALAISSLIVAKRPDAKQMLDKLAPYQGILGVILGLWGLWMTIQTLMHLSAFSALGLVTMLALDVVSLSLGMILGYNLVAQYTMKGNEAAMARGAALQAKLIKYQTPLGIAGIVLGVWGIVVTIMYM